MQKHVNLVDLVKSFPTNILLQNLASIQKRTSPIKFAQLAEKSEKGSISNHSTKVLRGLSVPERNAIVVQATALVRPVFVLWYFGCMFWKLNTAFFDPTGNCPSLYFCQLLDAYVPDALTPHWLVKWVVWSGPYVTELVEGGVALLMLTPGWSTRCGIALALLLHALIAITPPPNNIGAWAR